MRYKSLLAVTHITCPVTVLADFGLLCTDTHLVKLFSPRCDDLPILFHFLATFIHIISCLNRFYEASKN